MKRTLPPAVWDDVIAKWFQQQYPSREHRRALTVEEAFGAGYRRGFSLGHAVAKRAFEAQQKGIVK